MDIQFITPFTPERVLTLSLNFTITPNRTPHEDYILSTELACHKIQDQGQKAELRNTVAGILKSAKLQQSNETREEHKAKTHSKRTNPSLFTSRQRQNNSSNETYEAQMETLLADSNTHEILKRNPTKERKKTPKTIIGKHKNDTGAVWPFRTHSKYHSQIYGTPKTHKGTPHFTPLSTA